MEIGVQIYGGGLWHTWFDRDLTVAGRLMIKEKKGDSVTYSHKLVRIEEPIMRIPNLAIHLDRLVKTIIWCHFVDFCSVRLCNFSVRFKDDPINCHFFSFIDSL